jgi:hypothetical protein
MSIHSSGYRISSNLLTWDNSRPACNRTKYNPDGKALPSNIRLCVPLASDPSINVDTSRACKSYTVSFTRSLCSSAKEIREDELNGFG